MQVLLCGLELKLFILAFHKVKLKKITGFDEGYKPNWIKEFKKRDITVYGNIEPNAGEKVLQEYVKSGKEIYKPRS